jgi:hypothetical protein
MKGCVVRYSWALVMAFPLLARGGTPYVVTNTSLLPHTTSASHAQFYVSQGRVRAAEFDSHRVFLFKDRRIYLIDNAAKTIQVVTSALVDEGTARMDRRVQGMQDAAAQMPAEKRAVMERMAADMKAMNDSRRLAVPRDYRITDRSELVDGRSCRIWEVLEREAKRFEFCVAPAAQIPGGDEILDGMKSLSTYWQGSIFALGVSLGNVGWWSGIESLKGVPLLVREFRNGGAVSETTLTAIGDGVPNVPPFDLPAGYPMTEIDSLP